MIVIMMIILPCPGDDIDNDNDKDSDKMPDGCPRVLVIVAISLSNMMIARWLSTCPAPESPLLLCSRLSSAASRSPRSRLFLSSSSLPSWFLKSLQTPFHCGFVGQLWDNFKRTWGQLWDIWDNCWTTLRHIWNYVVTITSALSIWLITNLNPPFLLATCNGKIQCFPAKECDETLYNRHL